MYRASNLYALTEKGCQSRIQPQHMTVSLKLSIVPTTNVKSHSPRENIYLWTNPNQPYWDKGNMMDLKLTLE